MKHLKNYISSYQTLDAVSQTGKRGRIDLIFNAAPIDVKILYLSTDCGTKICVPARQNFSSPWQTGVTYSLNFGELFFEPSLRCSTIDGRFSHFLNMAEPSRWFIGQELKSIDNAAV
jgi:hypothetical protein